MKTVSVAEARKRLKALLDEVSSGHQVAGEPGHRPRSSGRALLMYIDTSLVPKSTRWRSNPHG